MAEQIDGRTREGREMKRAQAEDRKRAQVEDRPEQERRRRKARAGLTGRRMPVPESMLDRNKYAYRFFNDDPGGARIFNKTQEDDWDIVTKTGDVVTEDGDLGAAVSFVVGTLPDGSPRRAYLARKRLDYYKQDMAERQRAVDEIHAQLRNGQIDGDAADYVKPGVHSVR